MRSTAAGWIWAGLVALSAAGAAAQDGEAPVVVELFTSQGCASCPPADALLGELSARDDVIALALHVDYWDYIGWRDTFARPEFTARQHGYGHAAGSTVVYTPQMIVGGQDHVVGTRAMAVADLIQAHRAQPDPVVIAVTPEAGGYAVEAQARMDPPRPRMVVQLVTYIPHEEVPIDRGERAGTVGDHYNVVTSWQVVAEWDGAAPFVARITPQDAAVPHVLIVQQAGYGPILGAARLD
ncbi:DUF1223 domain-containing protein [Roseicyclus persicicus]|uniref:DUF1223 domain-containing protein n=1 Tax=Roseicyclus persicicus TaxID=2650661 RepID=A0A7X6JZE7_9RHOB|nr:DUF1223 domain-containing protein [Roseibacterium persicicum]NKX44728.1 DUF1223 domain-containing protein [Roseibacterium persicicum]